MRCIALHVGGGFGVKGHVYPEDLLVPFLARKLGRPVQRIEDRHEHLLCSCQSRDQTYHVDVGFDDEGRILRCVTASSWIAEHGIQSVLAWSDNTAVHLPGPYKINAIAFDALAATNKVPNAPYRGAGRPEAAFAMERATNSSPPNWVAEPAEVRLRNMVRADEMPYHMGLPYRDGQPIVYDGGDYPAALEKALGAIGGLPAFRERQRAAWQEGRYLGLGVGCYVEGTGVGPSRARRFGSIRRGKNLRDILRSSEGQGMETIFAQVVATLARCPTDVVISLAIMRGISIWLWHHRQPHDGYFIGGHSWRELHGCVRRCSRSPPTFWNARPLI